LRSGGKRSGSHRTLRQSRRPDGWQQLAKGAEVSRGHSSQTPVCNGPDTVKGRTMESREEPPGLVLSDEPDRGSYRNGA
ncbi:MAG: hypothetical protein AAFW84_06070, partial [Cyanobacteria bacterium J06635_15]